MARARKPKHRAGVDPLGFPVHTNVVFYQRGKWQSYYGKWYDPSRHQMSSKSFSVSRYGAKGAYEAACCLAKEMAEKAVKEKHERVYHTNDDGTTAMRLRHKNTQVDYLVDTNCVARLKEITWNIGNEGYALSTTPKWMYLHRFIMNAAPNEYVYHKNRDINDCRQENLQTTHNACDVPNSIGSINKLMSKRGNDRLIQRKGALTELKTACVQCAFADVRSLHFDHISRDNKSFNISSSQSIRKIKDEIQKCQVLCAFCHALKTRDEHEKNRRDKSLRTKRVLFTGVLNRMKLETFKSCEHCSRAVVAGQEQAFHFDHIDPTEKLSDISALANHGLCLETLLEEVTKTRLLCANCHAIRTHEQFQSGEINNLKRAKLADKLANGIETNYATSAYHQRSLNEIEQDFQP